MKSSVLKKLLIWSSIARLLSADVSLDSCSMKDTTLAAFSFILDISFLASRIKK